jgi:hypothetical protein
VEYDLPKRFGSPKGQGGCDFQGPRSINFNQLKWFMEFNWFIGKLAKWAFILYEYDFEIKHWAGTINKDVDGLHMNPHYNEMDITRTCWHWETNLETMFD